ncbi:MAG TPA: hypothetical protein VHN77_15420 [Phycisphaerales bacterium]|nr:hypothetical protein [Phycisphaerales bacterium]
MASINKGGQVGRSVMKTDPGGGIKKRSPTSNPHGGSRVEPSHTARQQKSERSSRRVSGK